jgi:hypothetical protein
MESEAMARDVEGLDKPESVCKEKEILQDFGVWSRHGKEEILPQKEVVKRVFWFLYLHSILLAIPRTKIISLCLISLVCGGVVCHEKGGTDARTSRESREMSPSTKFNSTAINSILENLLSFA